MDEEALNAEISNAYDVLVQFVKHRNAETAAGIIPLTDRALTLAILVLWEVAERSLFTDIELPANYKEAEAFDSEEAKLTVLKVRFLANALTCGSPSLFRTRQENDRIAAQKPLRSAHFEAMHRPAPEGTVAELAERYGKSKSEIRRLKAAGLLHTLA